MESVPGPNPGHLLVPVRACRGLGDPGMDEKQPNAPSASLTCTGRVPKANAQREEPRTKAARPQTASFSAGWTRHTPSGNSAGAARSGPRGQLQSDSNRGGSPGRSGSGRIREARRNGWTAPRRCRVRPKARADSTGKTGSSGELLSGQEQQAHLELHLRVHLEQRGHSGRCESGSRRATGRASRTPHHRHRLRCRRKWGHAAYPPIAARSLPAWPRRRVLAACRKEIEGNVEKKMAAAGASTLLVGPCRAVRHVRRRRWRRCGLGAEWSGEARHGGRTCACLHYAGQLCVPALQPAAEARYLLQDPRPAHHPGAHRYPARRGRVGRAGWTAPGADSFSPLAPLLTAAPARPGDAQEESALSEVRGGSGCGAAAPQTPVTAEPFPAGGLHGGSAGRRLQEVHPTSQVRGQGRARGHSAQCLPWAGGQAALRERCCVPRVLQSLLEPAPGGALHGLWKALRSSPLKPHTEDT